MATDVTPSAFMKVEKQTIGSERYYCYITMITKRKGENWMTLGPLVSELSNKKIKVVILYRTVELSMQET